MSGRPLVTVSIPTLNSAAFLANCLDAVSRQTYAHIEINIVDGNSMDDTVQVALRQGVHHVIHHSGALLGARLQGATEARGEYVLLLDSDQILHPAAIENAVCLCEGGLDMIVLGEGVHRCETMVERLFQLDRKLIHEIGDLSPYTGVVLPRFYRRNVLMDALHAIPARIVDKVGGQDHALIYYEAYRLSNRVAILPDAVEHIEPSTVKQVWRKFYRWGITSTDARIPEYQALLSRKERVRTGTFARGHIKASTGSVALLILKGVPYKLGAMVGKLKELTSRGADAKHRRAPH